MAVRLGHVHAGLMVDMRPQNAKLRGRARDMVARIAGVSATEAQAALEAAEWKIKPAILVARGMSATEAITALERAGDILRAALDQIE